MDAQTTPQIPSTNPRPGDLSRAEQLRVAVARALATRPGTLVVDDLGLTVVLRPETRRTPRSPAT